MEPTGPAPSGQPDDGLREIGTTSALTRITLRFMRVTRFAQPRNDWVPAFAATSAGRVLLGLRTISCVAAVETKTLR